MEIKNHYIEELNDIERQQNKHTFFNSVLYT